MKRSLPEGWAIAQHGPTFNATVNPYTVQGSNNTPIRHREKAEGTGIRAIDLLVSPPSADVGVTSRVLNTVFLSDHQFIQHTVNVRSGAPRSLVTRLPAAEPPDGTPGPH